MKNYKIVLLFVVTGVAFQPLFSQTTTKAIYIIVHGAWGGGWAFKDVDSLLTEAGSVVYRPTLTCLGERVHLATEKRRIRYAY